MTIYQTGKNILQKDNKFTEIIGSGLGAFSKLIASFVLYPFNLIRSKQQQIRNREVNISEDIKRNSITSNKDYRTFLAAYRTIYTNSGIRGFYFGVTPLLVRHIPSSALFFYTYEHVLKMLNDKN
jgi:solute carrier family 25 protein 38